MIMNQRGFDPQNLQHVKLDLPRQQWDANRAANASKRPWVGYNPAYVPPVAQEWTTPTTHQVPGRTLKINVPVKRVALAFGLLVAFLVTLGMGAMLGQQTPDSTTQSTLHYAQTHAPSGQTCGAVWLDGASRWTIECGTISR